MLQHLQIRIRDKHCCFRDYAFSKTVFQDILSCVIWLVVCLKAFLFYWSEQSYKSLTAVTGWLAAHLLLAEDVSDLQVD